MPASTFLRRVGGALVEVFGLQTSAGAADGGKIIALDDTGRLSTTMLPVGVGADTVALPATEAIAAGRYVNIYDAAGTTSVRLADASTNGKPADGFVLAAVANGGTATVYKEGTNTQLTGLTGGADLYLSASTPGAATATPPSTNGQVVQRIGKALGATAADFQRDQPILLGQAQA